MSTRDSAVFCPAHKQTFETYRRHQMESPEDLINRLCWLRDCLAGLKHETADRDVRRHLGRMVSHAELALERLRDNEEAAA